MRRGAIERSRIPLSQWLASRAARPAAFIMFSVALVLLACLPALTAPLAQAAHAAYTTRTGGSQPIIHWDASMIYAGQNNGYPWGPVGENTIVHGANFSPNVQLRLVVSPGNSNTVPKVCKQSVVTVVVATVITDTSGSFTQNFPWPAAAGQVNQGYSICALLASDNSIASSQDDGPFTVLAASPPAINISAASVTVGGSVTVIGQYWVPPQPVSIVIATCADCGGAVMVANTSATSTGLNSGAFSVTISIPSTAKPGAYVVDALTPTGLDANYTSGVKHLTIAAAPTTPASPTPTPTTQPSPSPTATATTQASATTTVSPTPAATTGGASGTVTTTTNGSGGTTDTGTSSSSSGMLLALIVTAMIFFLVAAAILVLLLLRRKRAGATARNAPHPIGSPVGQMGQSGQFGQYGQFNQFSPVGQFNQSSANYPSQYAQSGISPIPAGNFTPPPVLPPQQDGMGMTPAYGQYGQYGQPSQAGNDYQTFHAMPTEAYDVQHAYNIQNGNAPYGQPPNLPTCPNCGRPLVPNLPACSICGMPLSAMRQ